ncbi:MAG: glycosyltransferase [Pseudomonadales bacterium]|nr:glycosyltransferase [Pseudomonadales bacterium]
MVVLQRDVDCAVTLRQAITATSGDYVALVDEHLRVQLPHWLELFSAHAESTPYQVLGFSGYEKILFQDSVSEVSGRVVNETTRLSAPSMMGYSSGRFFGDTQVKEVVIVDGSCMFSRREVFQQFPIPECDPDKSSCLAQVLFQYQVHLVVECGQAQGVLLGIPYQMDKARSQNDSSALKHAWDKRYHHLLPLDPLQLSMWRYNFRALQGFDPAAAEQLLYLVSRDDGYRFQYRDHNRVSAVKGDQIALVVDHFNEVEKLPNGDTFIVCGAGTGLLIQHLLDQSVNEVLVVEPEYGLICELFKYYDWSDAISEGRLRFLPLVSGTPEADELTLNLTTRLLHIVLDKNTRTTNVIRGYSYHLHNAWYRRLEQGLLQYIDQRATLAKWVPQRKQVYDVTVVSPKCAIFANLAQCFNDIGLRTRLFNVPDQPDKLAVDQVRQLLVQLSMDGSRLTLCRNRSFFETENVRKAASLEKYILGNLVNWWWDVPNVASFIDFNDPLNNSENIGFATDLLGVLPEGSLWLPPAANVKCCRERPQNTGYEYDVSFVGQSRIPLLKNNMQSIVGFIKHLCGGIPDELFDALLKSNDFRSLHHTLIHLESDFSAMLNDLANVAPAHVYYFSYIFQMAKASAFRVAAIETLFANGVPVHVYGDSDWLHSGVVPVDYFKGPIATHALPALYQASRVNLNLNFMQVSSTVNPKVLDILASDGVVLTDYRPEIEALFPDPEKRPAYFHSLDDLLPALEKAFDNRVLENSWALSNEVRTKHTLLHRAHWFVEHYLN